METQARLAGRVALVFGAGSISEGWGNGKAAAVAYARNGARVVAVDHRLEAAQATCEAIRAEGGEALAVAADVTLLPDVQKAVAAALEAWGQVDVLHNNVGITSQGGPVETSEAMWDRVMTVNVKSMFLTCKCVLPLMEAQGRGAIVNIGALGGVRWTGYAYCAYAASKGAVNSLTQSVALQYAAKGIRANSLSPGNTYFPGGVWENIEQNNPELFATALGLNPTGRMARPEEIARAAVFLASPAASFMTGANLLVDGALTRGVQF